MRNASVVLGLVCVAAWCGPGPGQEPGRAPAVPCAGCTRTPPGHSGGKCTDCFLWTLGCFPRGGCCDDYCPHPFPRQCWPPYPPFYRCVPAGNCAHPPCVGVGNEGLTWWWVPTPRALRDALWCKP
jgi:hypothetical protein